MPGQQQQQ